MPVSTTHLQTTLGNWLLFMNEGKFDDLKALAAPGATWTIIGPADKFPDFCGEKPFSAVVDRISFVTTSFIGDSVASYKSINIGVDGKSAAVEVQTKGVWSGPSAGKVYDHVASLHVEFDEEGKVKAVREYLDLYAFEEFLRLK